MKTLKNLINDTKNVIEMRGLMDVYEELAATKMQKIRKDIMTSREFFDGLIKVSVEVGTDFEDLPQEEEKTATVFVSSNTGLYGDIINEVFSLFVEFIKKNKAEVYIVGKLGEKLVQDYGLKIPFKTIDLPDEDLTGQQFSELLQNMLPYKKIAVFYGRFRNIAIQVPSLTELSGDLLPKTTEGIEVLKKRRFQFLYEPSLFDVTKIFADEIRASILEQLLRESQLAKLGSRLIHLDETIEHINEQLNELGAQQAQLKKKILDKKQNALVSGIIARGAI